MSLDVAILDAAGRPETEVRIDHQAHADLMEHASRLECMLLLRMEDYYQDVDYGVQELSRLAEELRRVEETIGDEDDLAALVGELIGVTRMALAADKGLAVISD